MAAMISTISIATDLSVATGPTSHLGVLMPAPLSTVEAPVPMQWGPGAAAGTHRLAARVRHRGAAIVQQGHDVGPGVVHATAPPDPFAATRHALGSRRTVTAGFARVRVGGQAIGLVQGVGGTAAMSCCAEPLDLPVGDAPTNRLNSVTVGGAGAGARGEDPGPYTPRWGPSLRSAGSSTPSSCPPVMPTRDIIA